MNKFWEFRNEAKGKNADLVLEGPISSTTWFGDEVTPKAFRSELSKVNGDITVHINSPGGDVFAGVSIYNALKDFKGKVTVKVDGLAASIASVIAMAGDEIIMSPGSMMMIHNPWVMGSGNAEELRKVADYLDEVADSILPIYKDRTGLDESEITDMMADETWMSAEKAVELGFADTVLARKQCKEEGVKNLIYSNFAFNMSASKSAMEDLIKKVNNERNDSVEEDEKKFAEDVEVKDDGTVEGTVDGEKVELKPDEETKEEIEEATVEDENAEEKAEEPKGEEEEKEEEKSDEEVEDKSEDEVAEEGEQEGEEAQLQEGEAIADKIEAEIKALKEENAELKAKLEEATQATAKAQTALSAQDKLQARYAAILNMAEEADGGEKTSEKEDEKPVDTYANAIEDAFKSM